jgi:hypothetical protein
MYQVLTWTLTKLEQEGNISLGVVSKAKENGWDDFHRFD